MQPRESATLPSLENCFRIRLTASRALPMAIASFSCVKGMEAVPSSADSSIKKAATRLLESL